MRRYARDSLCLALAAPILLSAFVALILTLRNDVHHTPSSIKGLVGFIDPEATPFYIPTPDGELLHAWHIKSSGTRLNLAADPDARLILYLHGSGGFGGGPHPDTYQELRKEAHIITFDYRGHGESTGLPSEPGFVMDALAVADWAMARVKPQRIVVFGHGVGSAVAIDLVQNLAAREPAIEFAGVVIAGSVAETRHSMIPNQLSESIPIPFIPKPIHRWDSIERTGEFTDIAQKFHITVVHEEGNPDTTLEHSIRIFRRAVTGASRRVHVLDDVNAMLDRMLGDDVLHNKQTRVWGTTKGIIRLMQICHNPPDIKNSIADIRHSVSEAFTDPS